LEAEKENSDTVFVELERAEDLKEAYPNYFLDMTMFAQHVRAAMASEPLNVPLSKMPGQALPLSPNSVLRPQLEWWYNRTR
jgi:hypothetical protein